MRMNAQTTTQTTSIPTMTAERLDRIVVPPPCRGLDMAAGYGWVQSAAIRTGDFLFVSGVVAIDPDTGERLNGTLTSEAHRTFQNLQLILESAGSSLARLAQVRAMIYDRIEYDALNRVYRQYVPEGPPARTVWSVRIVDAFKVQLDAIALV
jgi:2-iminobutanoate/2-iminopropanoate deaminase